MNEIKQIKLKTIAAIYILFFVTTMELLLKNNIQVTNGPHGGKLKKTETFYIEKVQSHENIYVYLLNNKCIPINNKEIKGEIRFYFRDQTTSDAPLIPFESEGFEAKMSDENYHACRITFVISGKSISAIFDNDNLIVQKNK